MLRARQLLARFTGWSGMTYETKVEIVRKINGELDTIEEHANVTHAAIRALVEPYLKDPFNFEWSLQGLGMLRTYVGDHHRLHVWDDQYVVDDVSPLHTHPWDMRSYVVSGEIRQHRFVIDPLGEDGEPWNSISIKCGVGGGPCGEIQGVLLGRGPLEVYAAGESYDQKSDEIHTSFPVPGTVTLVERTVPEGGDPDFAYVYFQTDEWVSAEPRPATEDEIIAITDYALERFGA